MTQHSFCPGVCPLDPFHELPAGTPSAGGTRLLSRFQSSHRALTGRALGLGGVAPRPTCSVKSCSNSLWHANRHLRKLQSRHAERRRPARARLPRLHHRQHIREIRLTRHVLLRSYRYDLIRVPFGSYQGPTCSAILHRFKAISTSQSPSAIHSLFTPPRLLT